VPAVTGPALVAAALLALAGAQKVLDPSMTVGALQALKVPASPALVRAGAAGELVLGVTAATIGGWAVWGLVAVSYLAFAVFVGAALRSGTMIGSCGCFGREDTPPHWIHLLLDGALAATALWAAVDARPAPVEAIAEQGGGHAALVGLFAIGATVLLYAAFILLPRVLTFRHHPAAR